MNKTTIALIIAGLPAYLAFVVLAIPFAIMAAFFVLWLDYVELVKDAQAWIWRAIKPRHLEAK